MELEILTTKGGSVVLRSVGCPFDTDGDGDCGRPNCPHCAPTTEGKGRIVTKDGEVDRKADREADEMEPIQSDQHGLSLDAHPAQRDSRAIERLRPTDES